MSHAAIFSGQTLNLVLLEQELHLCSVPGLLSSFISFSQACIIISI